jgi:hypothetical protein
VSDGRTPEGARAAEDEQPLGRDERVSFYPMDPEEVLRRLLNTPPLDRAGQVGPVHDYGDTDK